LNITTTKP